MATIEEYLILTIQAYDIKKLHQSTEDTFYYNMYQPHSVIFCRLKLLQ